MGSAGGPAGVGAGTEQFQHSEVSARSEVFTKCSGARTTDQFIPFFDNYFQKMYPVLSLGADSDKQDRHSLSLHRHGASRPVGHACGEQEEGRRKAREERCGGTRLCAHDTLLHLPPEHQAPGAIHWPAPCSTAGWGGGCCMTSCHRGNVRASDTQHFVARPHGNLSTLSS